MKQDTQPGILHPEIIKQARSFFHRHIPIEASYPIRPEILRSWRRSREAGVSPYSKGGRLLTPAHFNAIKTANTLLLEIALPNIINFSSCIGNSQTCFLLTDAHGVVLHSIGAGTGFNETPSCSMVGYDAGEKIDGTTAMGVCLAEQKPCFVHGPEHYKCMFDSWHCAAAPIHGTGGRVIGSLGLAINHKDFHYHTLGMVSAVAAAISEQLKLRCLIQDQHTTLELLNEGVVALDAQGTLLHMNKYARKLFQVKEDVIGQRVEGLILNHNTLTRPKDNTPTLDQETVFHLVQGAAIHCTYSASITSEGGMVISLRERKRMQHLAKRFMDTTAKYTFADLLGTSPPILQAIQLAQMASSHDASLFILGESGVGKELFAQAIHNSSPRNHKPFVVLNCGATPRDLVQTELFGYAAGTFTRTANDEMPGKLDMADGGTLFLDEIDSIPLNVQELLLNVLQNGIMYRTGSQVVREINVRIIAATHHNVTAAVEQGTLRRDLYHRLNILSIYVPPLRERRGDIMLLANYFLQKYKQQRRVIGFSPEATHALERYMWPGNIRELENIIELLASTCEQSIIHLKDLPPELQTAHSYSPSAPSLQHTKKRTVPLPTTAPVLSPPEQRTLRSQEADAILTTIHETRGNLRVAAQKLGISRGTLYSRLRQYGIDPRILRAQHKHMYNI